MPLGALGKRRHAGGAGARLVGELAPSGLEAGVPLVGRLGLAAAAGDGVVEARSRRLQVGTAALLDLEVVGCHVGRGVAAGQLVGERVAERGGLARPCLGGRVGRLRRAQLGAGGRLRGGGRSRLGRRLRGTGLGFVCRSPVHRKCRRQPVALGACRHPGGLARVGRPPELSPVGVEPGPLAGDGDAPLDRRQVVDEPDAVDQPCRSRISDVGHLSQRAGARGRRKSGLERPCLTQHDPDLALALGAAKQVERLLDPLGDHGPGAPAERCRNRPLEARMRLDACHHELGTGRLERPRRG